MSQVAKLFKNGRSQAVRPAMESLLERLLAVQLTSLFDQATGKTNQGE